MLSPSEFERYLKRGLGRALQHLHQVDDRRPYLATVVDTCLHSTVFEVSVEPERAPYLWEAVRLCGTEDDLLKQLGKTPPDAADLDRLLEQRFTLLAIAFHQGYEVARRLLYEQVEACLHLGRLNGLDSIIAVDGQEGEVYLAQRLGERMLAGEQAEQPFMLLADWSPSRDRWDAHALALWERLQQVALESSGVARYVQAVEAYWQRQAGTIRRETPDLSKVSYPELKSWIADSTSRRSFSIYARWGRAASETDLQQAAHDLLALPDDAHRQATDYLSIFTGRMFPLEPNRIIAWAQQLDGQSPFHPDGTRNDLAFKAVRALNVLQRMKHPLVRQFALDCIERQTLLSWAIRMLIANPQSDDWELVRPLLQLSLADEVIHPLSMAIEDLFAASPAPDAIPILLQLIEVNPCSFCRHKLLRLLQSVDALPDWLRQECRYDANPDIRAFIAGLGENLKAGFLDFSPDHESHVIIDYAGVTKE